MNGEVPPHGDVDRPGAANGSGMGMFLFPPARASARPAAVAFTCLGGALLALGFLAHEEPRLAAASNQGRVDWDGDGLSDQQELVIGTRPDRPDTDGDTYSDLEERARGSDPLDAASQPGTAAFDVGTCASLENGYVTMLSAVYLDGGDLDSIELELGLVYHGLAITVSPRNYTNSRGFVLPGRDSGDRLAVVEIGLPESAVRRLGQVNLFSIVRGTGAGAPAPAVSVLPLVDFSGVTVVVEQRDSNTMNTSGEQPTGVVYRPLAGDDQIPASWNGGEICFQSTSAVGTNGVSLVHEVESADCQPMDTYCSPDDCRSGIGRPLELPDPGALAGG